MGCDLWGKVEIISQPLHHNYDLNMLQPHHTHEGETLYTQAASLYSLTTHKLRSTKPQEALAHMKGETIHKRLQHTTASPHKGEVQG